MYRRIQYNWLYRRLIDVYAGIAPMRLWDCTAATLTMERTIMGQLISLSIRRTLLMLVGNYQLAQ